MDPNETEENQGQLDLGEERNQIDPSVTLPTAELLAAKAAREAADKEKDSKEVEGSEETTEEAEGKEPEGEDGEEDPNAETQEEDGEEGASDFNADEWGDDGESDVVTAVFETLHGSGIKPTEAKALLFDAIQDGDVTKIDEAKLVEATGSAAQAKLILTGVKSVIRERDEKVQSIRASAEKAAGSKENWDAVSKWVREETSTENGAISKEEASELITLLGSGGRTAEVAARTLTEIYKENGGKLSKPARKIAKGDNTSAPKVEPITSAEYGRRMALLSQQGKLTQEAHANLRRQLRAGKNQ